jgi:putative sensory transduction regulator
MGSSMQLHWRFSSILGAASQPCYELANLRCRTIVEGGREQQAMNGSRPFKYLTSDPVLAATQIAGSVPQCRPTSGFVHAQIGGEGMTLIDISKVQRENPLEVVERMATTHLWSCERACEDEVTIVVQGKWSDYQVSFTWMHDMEALHLACSFELKVPEHNKAEVSIWFR